MAINLYGMKGSTCTRRALTALEETGTPYTFHLVNLMKGEHKTPEYIANHHPFGKIPVFEEGGFKLYESRAILRYVAKKYDKTGTFFPHDDHALGLAEQWISVELDYLQAETLVGQLVFGKFRGTPVDEEKVKKADESLRHTLSVVDKHLATHKFLAGEHFTYADVAWLPYLQYLVDRAEGYSTIFDGFPHVKRWFHDSTSRPSWKKVHSESEF